MQGLRAVVPHDTVVFLMNRRILKSILATLLVVAACSKLADVTGPRASRATGSSAPRFTTQVGRSSVVASLDPRATPAGLIACIGGEGTAVDSVMGRPGTITGNVTFVPGHFGTAFSINDVTADISIRSDSSLNVGTGPGMTLTAWAYTRGDWFTTVTSEAPKGSGPILEFNGGAHIWSHEQYLDPENAEFANLVDVNGGWHIVQQQNVAMKLRWNLIALTYDRATGWEKLWANGIVTDSAFVGDIRVSTTGDLHIGSRNEFSPFGSDRFTFNGIIDEPAIYNRALTKEELVALTASTSSICFPKPIVLRAVSVPTAVESGVPFSASFDLMTSTGVRARNYNNVTAQLYSGAGTLLGTTTVSADSGRATFSNLILAGPSTGTTLVISSSEITDLITVPITVTQVVRRVNLLNAPLLTSLGAPLTPQPNVELLDAAGLRMANSGNTVTASLASGPAGGTITGTTSVTSTNGLASFSNLSVAGALGSYTVNLSSGAATVGTFSVATGTQLAIDTPPTTVDNGGTLGSFTVRVANALGITNPSSTAQVSVTATNGTVTGTTTVTAVNGVATFSGLGITSSTPATPVTLTVSAPLFPSVPLSITVTQTPTTASFVTQPTSATLNIPLAPQPSVRVLDKAGQPMVSGTVTAAIAATPSALGGTTTASIIAGVASFSNLVLTSLGSYNITLTAGGTAAPLTLPLSVTQTAQAISVLNAPAATVLGSALVPQPSVELLDATGARMASSGNVVSASIVDGPVGGTLTGTLSATSVNGVATFTNLGVATSLGSYTIALNSGAATAGIFVVSTGTQLLVDVPPTSVVNGGTLSTFAVRVADATGTTTSSSTAPVTVTATNGTVAGTTTVNAVNGVATFTGLRITSTTAATPVTLTVSAPQFPAVPLSIAITQTAATASFVTQPTSASLNVAWNPQPSIRVLDNAGQPMTSGTVTASVASSPTSLSGTTTVPVVNGVATFTDLSLTSVGVFTISFNAGGTATPLTLLLTTTGGGTNPGGATATQVAITSAPTTVESGASMTTPFRVEIRDVNGALVSNAAVTVSATIASGSSGVLQGTTSVTSVNGVATFTNLRVGSTAGTVRLQFASAGLSSATSTAVTVTQVVRQLALVTQPGTPRLASTLTVQPVVELRDAAGLAVASGTGSVTASIGSGTAGTLTGANPVTATAGRATFTNLALNGTGSYTLVFSMSGASSVTSSAISFAGTASLVFNGFLSPIDMGRVNVIEAGRVLPLRYSVTGVTAGTPVIRSFTSVQEACAVPTLLDHPWNGAGKVWDDRVRGAFTDDDDDVPEGYGQYDARRGYYHVNFATQRSWAGTCRLFTATLIDGTTRTVHFRFKRGASNTDSNDMTAWWGADATRRFKPILDAWKRAWKDSD